MTTTLPDDLADKMIALRREIHQNPELSHDERETSALVRRELEAAGITEIDTFFDTGLVATIRGAGDGRLLALRADMDALPIEEAVALPFASRNSGVMHACGHDAHTAVLLGVTLALNDTRDSFGGTVRCIFQPAEEAEPLGGREVVKAGHLDGVEGVLALHVDPTLDAGAIGVRAGALLAGGQEFTIEVCGRSAHAARPQQSIDTISVAAAIVQELQKIVSRRTDPLEPVVVTIGKIHGGTAKNVIADRTVIEGTFRVLDEGLRGAVSGMIRDIAAGIAAAHGAEALVETSEGEPVMVNDPALTELVRQTGRDLLGDENVHEIALPSMGSEDFAFYAQAVPAMMFRLGVRNEAEGMVSPVHHPGFAIDERAIPVGAAVMLEAARRFLGEKQS